MAYGQTFKKLVKEGDRFRSKGQINAALDSYLQANELNPGNADLYLQIGITYMLSSSAKHKALPYLSRVYSLDPNISPDINFYMGSAYQYNHMYTEALIQFKEYQKKGIRVMRKTTERRIAECTIGDSLYRRPKRVLIENMGPTINSTAHDYTPLISSDGNTLIFTSRRDGSTGGLKTKEGGNFEDIYISRRRSDGKWSPPSNISKNINFEFHDAAAALSGDGKQLFIYYEEGNGDIYVSNYENGEWTVPESLGDNINSYYWEPSLSISSDGQTIFFSSDRPGGYGQLDIYTSQKQEDGTWGTPVNMGPDINTSNNDDSPFIHPDGKTLYFSSDGHIGMGNYDIFKSEWRDSVWSKPMNMGYPINSADDDGFFVISEDRKTAYYASVKEEGIGNADIYSIDMDAAVTEEEVIAKNTPNVSPDTTEEEVQIQKEMGVVTLLRGKVLDDKSAQPLGARLTLVDNQKNKIITEVDSDPTTGDFEILIPHGSNYGLSTSREGYLFNSINFNVPAFSEYRELDISIFLQLAEVGSKIVLKNIFFDTGKATFKTESLSELQRIRSLMRENPDVGIQVNGHTDNVGNATYNKLLSKKRAQAVVDYLTNNAIEESRLIAKGFGEEFPLVSNDDEQDGREINRRTEIEIIENN